MHPVFKLGINIALSLIIVPIIVLIAFFVDTSILGHVEGFNGVFVGAPIGIIIGFIYLCCSVWKFFKDLKSRKKQIQQIK
jgi:flagellar biosynthesis protein FliR